MKPLLGMLNQYETDIVNVESVQSFVNMKQFDDYDKNGDNSDKEKIRTFLQIVVFNVGHRQTFS